LFDCYDQIDVPKQNKAIKIGHPEILDDYTLYQTLDEKCKQQNKKVYIVTRNIVDNWNLDNIKIVFVEEIFGLDYVFDIKYPQQPTKLYNCFIQRVDSVRQSWFYFLQHYKLLDKGYVSFLLYQLVNYSELEGIELYDFIHKKYKLGELKHFEHAYIQMRNKVPYKNFEENYNLAEYINESKYTVTLDTWATSDSHVAANYSEKVHRALQCPTNNLFFVQQNSLAKLHRLGFDIPEYMLEIDKHPWQKRQQMILDILVNDTIDYDAEILYNRAMHNRNKFKHYSDLVDNGDFYSRIFDTVRQT
jgi:hypothetical protein